MFFYRIVTNSDVISIHYLKQNKTIYRPGNLSKLENFLNMLTRMNSWNYYSPVLFLILLDSVSNGLVFVHIDIEGPHTYQRATNMYEVEKDTEFNVSCVTNIPGGNMPTLTDEKNEFLKPKCKNHSSNVSVRYTCQNFSSIDSVQFVCEVVRTKNVSQSLYVTLRSTIQVIFKSTLSICNENYAGDGSNNVYSLRTDFQSPCSVACFRYTSTGLYHGVSEAAACTQATRCVNLVHRSDELKMSPQVNVQPRLITKIANASMRSYECSSNLSSGYLYWAVFNNHGNILEPSVDISLISPLYVSITTDKDGNTTLTLSESESIDSFANLNELHTVICVTNSAKETGMASMHLGKHDGSSDEDQNKEQGVTTRDTTTSETNYSLHDVIHGTVTQSLPQTSIFWQESRYMIIIGTAVATTTVLVVLIALVLFACKRVNINEPSTPMPISDIVYDDVAHDTEMVDNTAYLPFHETETVERCKAENTLYSSIDDTIQLESSA